MLFSKKSDELETNIEVKTKEDVEFDVEESWVDPITKYKRKRQAKKAEEERKRIEEEKRRKAEETKKLVIALVMMAISFGGLLILATRSDDSDLLDYPSEPIASEDTIDQEEPDYAEDENDIDTYIDEDEQMEPVDIYGEDVIKNPTEATDFGFVKLRARASYHSDNGGWSFYVLNRDGSRGSWFDIEDELYPDNLDEYSEGLFKQCSGKYAEVKDYIFTMTGYGSWVPLKNKDESDDDGGTFVFEPVELLEVEYDNEDKALIYN